MHRNHATLICGEVLDRVVAKARTVESDSGAVPLLENDGRGFAPFEVDEVHAEHAHGLDEVVLEAAAAGVIIWIVDETVTVAVIQPFGQNDKVAERRGVGASARANARAAERLIRCAEVGVAASWVATVERDGSVGSAVSDELDAPGSVDVFQPLAGYNRIAKGV